MPGYQAFPCLPTYLYGGRGVVIEAFRTTPTPASPMTSVIGRDDPHGIFLVLSLNLCSGKGILSFGFVLAEAIDRFS